MAGFSIPVGTILRVKKLNVKPIPADVFGSGVRVG